jgi:hypothetical protein
MPTYRDYHFAHASEKAAFEQLQSLDDGHIHLWPTIEGTRLHEIDLFLIDDAIGAFIIEIKAIPIRFLEHFNADCMTVRNEKQRRSAIKQAQTQLYDLRSYVEGQGRYFPQTVATVLWTNISRKEWQQTWAKNKQALDLGNGMLFREDIDSGTTHFRRQLTTLFEKPAIRQGCTPGAVPNLAIQELIEILGNKSAERSDETDQQMLETFERYYRDVAQQRAPLDAISRIALSGVPGTGKTWQLLSIAKFHAEHGKHVLFLCYNHVLKTNIEQMVGAFRKGPDYGSITVHTIFDQIGLLNATGNLGCVLHEEEFDAFADEVIQQMFMRDFLWETYDTVLLDEAQDLKQYVGPLLQAITLENTNIVIGVGTGQNLYLETAPAWLNAFMKESEVCELEKVYRTTAQTFQAAQIVCEAFTSKEQIETVAKRVLSGKCHGLSEEVRPLRSIGRPPAIRRYKVEAGPNTENAEMHVSGMKTQVEAILSELEDGEKFSDILFLIPTSKSPAYHALLKALDMLDVHRIDFTIKGNRNTTPRDHQVRISTFHSSRGVEASIVVLLDLERLAERTRARQQLYIGLTRAVRLAIVLEPDIAVSQLSTLLERAAACINAASTNQDFKKNIPQRPVKRPTSTSVKSAIPIDQATQSGTSQAEAQNDDTDGEVIHIPDDIAESLTLNVESASSVDTVSTTEQADTHSSQITAEAQSAATRDQQTAKRHESVPSGFGTSIFAVVASKTVDIGKRIDALYNWDTYTDLSEE